MNTNLILKLDADNETKVKLVGTLSEINQTANRVSKLCWERKVFDKNDAIREFYEEIRRNNSLGSQVVLKAFNRVSMAYRYDKSELKTFKITEPVLYDRNILSYVGENTVSMWCIGGRRKIKFTCKTPSLLNNKKNGAYLIFKNNSFYLLQNIVININSDFELVYGEFLD